MVHNLARRLFHKFQWYADRRVLGPAAGSGGCILPLKPRPMLVPGIVKKELLDSDRVRIDSEMRCPHLAGQARCRATVGIV